MQHSPAKIARVYGPLVNVDHIHGVSFDGRRVWAAVGDRLLALDRENGAVVKEITVPATAGTAFDGTYLYQIGDREIRKIDPVSSKVVSSFAVPGDGPVAGMAWSDGFLWIGRNRDRRIDKVDPETGEVLRTITVDHMITGVTWHRDDLWHGSWEADRGTLYRVDPESGKALERIDLPDGTAVTGLEGDDKDSFFAAAAKAEKSASFAQPVSGARRKPIKRASAYAYSRKQPRAKRLGSRVVSASAIVGAESI